MGLDWGEWASAVSLGVLNVRDDVLRSAAQVLVGSRIILTAGNGGSSALASHAAQALGKPAYKAGAGLAAACLSDMTPTLTAHANDGGWANALMETARPFFERSVGGVTLLLFSSSGQSENIVQLVRMGTKENCEIIAFTGFDGGALKQRATVSLHVDSRDYEVIEPVHDALLHRIQYHVRALVQSTQLVDAP